MLTIEIVNEVLRQLVNNTKNNGTEGIFKASRGTSLDALTPAIGEMTFTGEDFPASWAELGGKTLWFGSVTDITVGGVGTITAATDSSVTINVTQIGQASVRSDWILGVFDVPVTDYDDLLRELADMESLGFQNRSGYPLLMNIESINTIAEHMGVSIRHGTVPNRKLSDQFFMNIDETGVRDLNRALYQYDTMTGMVFIPNGHIWSGDISNTATKVFLRRLGQA
jgi:hypothetical protein